MAAAEQSKMREIREGHLIPEWLESTLRQKGCEVLDAEWDA